jgi:hypothetical protein
MRLVIGRSCQGIDRQTFGKSESERTWLQCACVALSLSRVSYFWCAEVDT